ERFDTVDQSHRLPRHLDPAGRLSALVNHAYPGAIQRYVDSRIILHGRPLMMLGGGKPRLQLNDTISLRDDRRCASKPRTKRACKACAAAGPLPHQVKICCIFMPSYDEDTSEIRYSHQLP